MSLSEFLSGPNSGYVRLLLDRYLADPKRVSPAWRAVFDGEAADVRDPAVVVPAPGPEIAETRTMPRRSRAAKRARDETRNATVRAMEGLLRLVARAAALAQALRDHGHQLARIDPLGSDPPGHPQLDPAFFGTSMEELEALPASTLLDEGGSERVPDYLRRLQRAYCGPIGYQCEHLESPERVRWLWNEVESGAHTQPLGGARKARLLARLAEVEGLERFLHRAYPGQVRFSLEGNDMLVPMVDLLIDLAVSHGCREVVMGMAHRGRLNVLAHSVGIGYGDILRQFEGTPPVSDVILSGEEGGIGDVKYHHGAIRERTTEDGASVRITLLPNPSHLEFVNPIVAGLARARQFEGADPGREQNTAAVVPLLIHGDAAFAAEGIVAESLNLARLDGYTTGGVIHLIVNNQIGFTTDPDQGRSTRYASDLAKGYDIPVLRVNADDPPACLAAIRLAMAYRAKFHDDIVIDLIGYRRHGHNEGDDPAYTQPRLYELIKTHPTVLDLWADTLVEEGTVTAEEASASRRRVAARLRTALNDLAEEGRPASRESRTNATELHPPSVSFDTLSRVNAAATAIPEGFAPHPKLKRQLGGRRLIPESSLDWAHAEVLALGSLLLEGVPIRLSGQDSQRGTFSHRHLVLHDVRSGVRHIPLATLGEARFEVYNSPLSETAVLGFEYGYSVGAAADLVLWEAQFGDFANVAQPIIDQFVVSGRAKWGQRSRLVLLLPHGHEGRGPEHSSARLERFLQMCAVDNIRVAYPTTSGQYFHLLRRQAHAVERPLVVMTPKSLLRHKLARSPVSELTTGGFRPVFADPSAEERKTTSRLVLSTGKVYYDLAASAEYAGASNLALARVEQLYPFPSNEIRELLAGLPRLKEVVWVQEEPRNMGAHDYVVPRLRPLLSEQVSFRQVARPAWASPAEGATADHTTGQRRIIRRAFAARRE